MTTLRISLVILFFSTNLLLAQDVNVFLDSLKNACAQKDQQALLSLFVRETEVQKKIAKLQSYNMLNQAAFITFRTKVIVRFPQHEFNEIFGNFGYMAIVTWSVLPPICDEETITELKIGEEYVTVYFENSNYEGTSKLKLIRRDGRLLIDTKWRKDDSSEVLALMEKSMEILKDGEVLIENNAPRAEFIAKMQAHDKALQEAFKR